MPPPEPERDASDIPLSAHDRQRLQEELARIYSRSESVEHFLDQIGFPLERIPIFRPGEGESFWSKIFTELDRGAIDSPYRRMLETALGQHESYRDLTDLARRYSVSPQSGSGEPDQFGAAVAAHCHIIVRGGQEDRVQAVRWLATCGLDPRELWSRADSASFLVNQANPVAVTRLVLQRPDLSCTIVPPGTPDDLIGEVVVRDDDGRELAISQVPSQAKVADVLELLVRENPSANLNAAQLRVTSRIRDGRRRNVNPGRTLADVGYRQGDKLGVETLAPGEPIKVFLIGASPRETEHIRPEMEVRAIRYAGESGKHLELKECLGAQADDLHQIPGFKPDILHFACHGENGYLLLQDDQSFPNPVWPHDVAEWLRHHVSKGRLRLSGIVLSVCNGEQIAKAFEPVADIVIAHKQLLDENCAFAFTTAFYTELIDTPDLRDAAWSAAYFAQIKLGRSTAIADNLIVLPEQPTGGLEQWRPAEG